MNASVSGLKIGMSKFMQLSLFLIALFNISFLQAQQVCRKYPLPGSKSVSPEVSIQVQFNRPYINAVSGGNVDIVVRGEKKGIYEGTVKQVNENTLIFKPENGFLTGDLIRIRMRDLRNPGNDLDYEFRISDRVFSTEESRELYNMFRDEPLQAEPAEVKSETVSQGYRPRLVNGLAVPSDFPEIIPSIQKETAPGNIFMNNRTGVPYVLIFKNDGTPYFYRKVSQRSMDFKVQPTGVLSRMLRESPWGFEIIDTNFRRERVWKTQGYVTDEHDLQLTLDGTAYMIGIEYRYLDMSELVSGGDTAAKVMGTLIQEVDASGNVLFEWNGWDHFNITDACHQSLTSNFIDFIHTNSVAVDYDGNVVTSSRHQSECTKINRQTGEVMWRLGGKYNQFRFMDGNSISYQHDFRPVPGKPGHYTLFDNGNYKAVKYSRVVEYRLDLDSMQAHNVWEYRATPDRYSFWMGSAQRLPNGNTFICWADGSLPKVTEVTHKKEVVYEADYREFSHCYRGFRFEWQGMLTEPELIAEKDVDKISLIYHKFGDTSLVAYNVYADTFPNPGTLIATTNENYINLDDRQLLTDVTYYFRVRALYDDGSESEASNEISVLTDFILAGENMLKNPNFSAGLYPWTFNSSNGAAAVGSISPEGKFTIEISRGGVFYQNIQLKQTGIPVVKGKQYVLGFDAVASAARLIEAKVSQGVHPFTNYSKNGMTYVTGDLQHFKYNFLMIDPSDFNAILVFNCGNDTADLIIDNVYLREPFLDTSANVALNNPLEKSILLYPNPAHDILNIFVDYPDHRELKIAICDGSGRLVRLLQAGQNGEEHIIIHEDISDLEQGIYIIAVRVDGPVVARKLFIVQ